MSYPTSCFSTKVIRPFDLLLQWLCIDYRPCCQRFTFSISGYCFTDKPVESILLVLCVLVCLCLLLLCEDFFRFPCSLATSICSPWFMLSCNCHTNIFVVLSSLSFPLTFILTAPGTLHDARIMHWVYILYFLGYACWCLHCLTAQELFVL